MTKNKNKKKQKTKKQKNKEGEKHYIWWCISITQEKKVLNTYAKGGKMITPEQLQLLAF